MTKAAITKLIQEVADALDSPAHNNFKISMGTPGDNLPNSIDQIQPTGSAWVPEPKIFPIIAEGLARYMGKAREMSTSGDLLETDRRIELTGNNVTVTLPAAEAKYIGEFIIKSKGFTGGTVSGTIDGGAASLPVANWEFIQLYCDGADWLTG